MNQLTILTTTVNSVDTAHQIAAVLIERCEAACVQEQVIRSRYRWEGKVCCEEEIRLDVKTSQNKKSAALKTILELHPYAVPEVLERVAQSLNDEYTTWVEHETKRAVD